MTEAEIRLECVRLALAVHNTGSQDGSIIATAQAMHDFVMNAAQPEEATKAA